MSAKPGERRKTITILQAYDTVGPIERKSGSGIRSVERQSRHRRPWWQTETGGFLCRTTASIP